MMAVEMLSGPSCGNNIIELDETCDGINLGAATCESLGWSAGGTLACGPTCLYKTSACASVCPDSDLDGVCDDNDICPGGNDRSDSDSDGVPDGCDACPTEGVEC